LIAFRAANYRELPFGKDEFQSARPPVADRRVKQRHPDHLVATEFVMARVLVLYHSTYGHIEAMAQAQAEGARSVPGTQVDIKRVPELVPDDVARNAGYKMDQQADVASIADLEAYDAIIVGCGTRFGRMASQMANFLDQAGGLWARGALNGKVGAAFSSTATQHGGQETTLFSILTNLFHFGMVCVGLPYSFAGQMTLDEITGAAPYGATTITGGQGQRMPRQNELEGARFQGRLVAETAAKLHGAYTGDIVHEPPQEDARVWKEAPADS
jgi:NAD(P)H dehydrogenase (quinone)